MSLTFDEIKNDREINTYIRKADDAMCAIGYTEHSFPHVNKCADQAAFILSALTYPPRVVELARIAGYLHDIGNVINRHDHAHSGAIMSFQILCKRGMDPEEVATVVCAIGNHDEATGAPINEVAAALILADKGDVRRSRVRNADYLTSDIHDRVNYAVEESALDLDTARMSIALRLTIDTGQCAVMDYFEIFLTRMLLCRRAAEYLNLHFKLVINNVELL
jgi:metal-dependent HD superfamily phosphatase/phosphodiesterase